AGADQEQQQQKRPLPGESSFEVQHCPAISLLIRTRYHDLACRYGCRVVVRFLHRQCQRNPVLERDQFRVHASPLSSPRGGPRHSDAQNASTLSVPTTDPPPAAKVTVTACPTALPIPCSNLS